MVKSYINIFYQNTHVDSFENLSFLIGGFDLEIKNEGGFVYDSQIMETNGNRVFLNLFDERQDYE